MSTFFQTQMTGPCSSAGAIIIRTQLRQKVRGYEALFPCTANGKLHILATRNNSPIKNSFLTVVWKMTTTAITRKNHLQTVHEFVGLLRAEVEIWLLVVGRQEGHCVSQQRHPEVLGS